MISTGARAKLVEAVQLCSRDWIGRTKERLQITDYGSGSKPSHATICSRTFP